MASLEKLVTPCLLLDLAKLRRNCESMSTHIRSLGGTLRPHLKTGKSVEVAAITVGDHTTRITVSSVREAEYFFEAGYRDILYAVGIAAPKLGRLAALVTKGATISVLVDSDAGAEALCTQADTLAQPIHALIEVDSDGHRAGINPDSGELITIASRLHNSDTVIFGGVLTHAGASYGCASVEAIEAMAEQERCAAVRAATNLRAAGLGVATVSIGSTPTARFTRNLDGVTEVRAGVYVFYDLVMAGIGVCKPEDIAISVLCTVIGHQPGKNALIIDAGWMALSRDQGTQRHRVNHGYGLVCDRTGTVLDGINVVEVSQEHGLVQAREQAKLDLEAHPVGTVLRVLPIHACATAAAHDEYILTDEHHTPTERWSRCRGW